MTGLVSGFGREDTERPTQTLQLTEQEQQLQEQQMANDAGKEQVEVGGSLSFGGDSFALTQQEDGAWALVRTSSTGTSTTLFLLEGTPVALARISDTILIPENRNGGWDVVCYVIDGHSSASYVSSPDGTVVGGEGRRGERRAGGHRHRGDGLLRGRSRGLARLGVGSRRSGSKLF